MRNSTTPPLGILSIIAIGFLFIASAASAQDDHVIAIGQVNSTGTLANSANTVGGVVASVQNGTGDYTVTVTAVGAFAGTASSDYVGEVTCEDTLSDDQVAKISISVTTDDVLTIRVHTDDVEDTTNATLAEPANNAFFFSIYRVPVSFPVKGSTKYLIAAGKVAANGSLLSGAGVDGMVVASTQIGTGSYNVTLTKTGAFAGAVSNDFVIQLCLDGSGLTTHDDAVRGGVNTISDDVMTVRVRTDDVQDPTDDNFALPQNNAFHIVVYRIPPGGGAGLAQSKLLVAMGRVLATGTLSNGGAFDGGAVASIRNSDGDYTVTITSPGAFAGKSVHQFVLQLHLLQNFSADEVIEGFVGIPDANTLTLTIGTNDAENALIIGDPIDSSFYFVIYDAAPFFRPDLRIGTKRNLTRHIGDDIYNASGASQKVRVGLPGTLKKKYFLSLENDGNLLDDIFLKANRSGNKIKSKYFRLTNGRKNATGAITSAGHVVDDVPPCKIIKFEVQAKYKRPNKRPRKTLRILARSQFLATQRDVNKATLRRR